MARKRTQKVPPGGAGKPRDRKAEYRARDKKARRWGFRSYWEQRQKGQWASFLRYLRPDDLVMLVRPVGQMKRDSLGRWERIEKVVHPDDPKRASKVFVMKNLTDRQLRRLIEEELARGANLTPIPSLDQRRLIGDI